MFQLKILSPEKLQARKNLVAIFQNIVDDRRKQKEQNVQRERKDMMDALIEVEDENGRKLSDEEIIDVLLMYLNAGHESSGHTIMWATIFLQQHPEILQKARVHINPQSDSSTFCNFNETSCKTTPI